MKTSTVKETASVACCRFSRHGSFANGDDKGSVSSRQDVEAFFTGRYFLMVIALFKNMLVLQ